MRLVRRHELVDPPEVQGLRSGEAELSQYQLSCKAVVDGETVHVFQMVDAQAYDTDPALREYADAALRNALALEIVKKWKPKIRKERPSPAFFGDLVIE